MQHYATPAQSYPPNITLDHTGNLPQLYRHLVQAVSHTRVTHKSHITHFALMYALALLMISLNVYDLVLDMVDNFRMAESLFSLYFTVSCLYPFSFAMPCHLIRCCLQELNMQLAQLCNQHQNTDLYEVMFHVIYRNSKVS